jgi:3',5'-cyclic-AMP phosphodiesterase
MPIYLPPISRRQFLAGALAAGTALTHWPFGAEAEAGEGTLSSRYLLISDVHVGTHLRDKKHDVRPGVEFSDAIKQILGMSDRPKTVIAAGDYAMSHGNQGNCKMFYELMSRFSEAGLGCYFALGNHDSRRSFLDEFPRAKELIDPHGKALGRYVHVMETPLANWFFVDSLHENDRNLGVLGEPQLHWLAHALDARPDKPALVVGHHNPSLKSHLRDTAAFYDVITPRKQVKAYVYGHTHEWNLDKHEGIHLVNVPTVSAWKDDNQPRGFVAAELHRRGMALALHTLGHHEGKQYDLAWRKG